MLKIFYFFTILLFTNFLYADVNTNVTLDLENGKNKAQICATCHGVDGNSVVPMWPKIAGQFSTYMIKQMNSFKLNGGDGRANPVMYNIVKDLSEKDINDVSNFYALKNVSKNSVIKNKDAYEKGRILYLLGDFKNKKTPACSSCHGIGGEGNFLAGFPKLKNQHSQYIIQQLKAYKDGERSNDFNMIMRDISSNLTEEQITCVAEYINNM